MPRITGVFSPGEPDPVLLQRLVLVTYWYLVLVGLLVLVNFAGASVPGVVSFFPGRWPLMSADSGLALVLGLFSLILAGASQSKWKHRLSTVLAALIPIIAAADLADRLHPALAGGFLPLWRSVLPPAVARPMTIEPAISFVLLGATLLLIRARKHFAAHVADAAAYGLAFVVMTAAAGFVFCTMPLFGPSAHVQNPPLTIFCLLLLTVAVLIRRAEHGVFAILLGQGMGSKIARILSPVVLILPFLREVARAHLINTLHMPRHYSTAVPASIAAMIAIALTLYLARRIHEMEMEIHDLSLRDALTGLYNRKGFYLPAEQALRMAHRSHLPFSVLFIDLDNLKQTNDLLGHQTGSEFLAETGVILKKVLRETDILGRIGGDEFAVAGHFDGTSISLAVQRIEDCAARRNAEKQRQFSLSFSIGHVTAERAEAESLEELIARADRAMYEEKRRKKMADGSGPDWA